MKKLHTICWKKAIQHLMILTDIGQVFIRE
ncbi:hypothetical protein JOD43_002719 [Pullulanibacillus pueri]|nr:hypothetical protein [Pullulanibacillus pueri]